VQPLGGSAATMNGLRSNRSELAITSAFAVRSAFEGTGPFKGKPVDVRLLLQGQPSYRGFLVRKDAGIKSFTDLKGKIVASDRPALPALKLVFNAMAKVSGLAPNAVRNVRMSTFGEQQNALVTGTAVGGVFAFGARAATIGQMLNSGEVVPFYLPADMRDKVAKLLPQAFYGADLPAKTWPEQTNVWHLFAMKSYLNARADVPADVAYKIVKSILDHHDVFDTYHAAAKSWTLKATLENPIVPFHEGAIRYFKEKGMWTPELEARQQQLLKK
jgi:TRAP transporter TAXI family solute receptor